MLCVCDLVKSSKGKTKTEATVTSQNVLVIVFFLFCSDLALVSIWLVCCPIVYVLDHSAVGSAAELLLLLLNFIVGLNGRAV